MDFFNKLTKKASQTLQYTKEKANTISGELKIRGKISDAKDKIEDLYKEIGEIVYSQMQSQTDVAKEDITAKCEEISRLKTEIEKLEIEILALKDLKKCEGCGVELEFNAEFCSKCGKKQPKIEKVEVEIKDETPEAKDAEVVEIKNIEEPEEKKTEENANVENTVESSEENKNMNVENNTDEINEENNNEDETKTNTDNNEQN